MLINFAGLSVHDMLPEHLENLQSKVNKDYEDHSQHSLVDQVSRIVVYWHTYLTILSQVWDSGYFGVSERCALWLT